MHCGAPVLAGNNSSQIEVVGDAGLLFNVADAGELAAQLALVLDDTAPSRPLRERAVVQARRFRWEETADKTLDALTRSRALEPRVHSRSERRRGPRRRIAYFSPLPPLPSEVSNYSTRLLDELQRRYMIDLYHDEGYLPHQALSCPDFGCHDYRLFERNARVIRYHAVVYQMGNSQYDAYMYETLLRHQGIITLHDFSTTGFQSRYATQPGVNGEAYVWRHFEAFREGSSDKMLRSSAASADPDRGVPATGIKKEYRLNGRIFKQAAAMIVHSPWYAEQLQGRTPAHFGKTFVIAYGATTLERSPEQRTGIRARFGLPLEALIIAGFGAIHDNNINSETVAAFAPLARAIPEAILIFPRPDSDDGEARLAVSRLDLQQRVRFLEDRTAPVLAELAAIADIGICLGRPANSSENLGALTALLGHGVPTIVSDVGSFSCFPDFVVRKLRWESHGLAGLTQVLHELATDRQGREALGQAALDYARQNHDWARVAAAYEEIIEWTVTDRIRSQAKGYPVAYGGQAAALPGWVHATS
jgi:glycosyltransferase involved in cell wall biosynthesis